MFHLQWVDRELQGTGICAIRTFVQGEIHVASAAKAKISTLLGEFKAKAYEKV